MNMFYAVLCYAMAVHNLVKALDGIIVMNFILAAMWLVIGVAFTARHVNELRKAKKKKQIREMEE